jgi:histidyl-tRNA synthetase
MFICGTVLRRLLGTFGGEDVPCCGFGFGDAVIVELLKERGKLPQPPHKVVWGAMPCNGCTCQRDRLPDASMMTLAAAVVSTSCHLANSGLIATAHCTCVEGWLD